MHTRLLPVSPSRQKARRARRDERGIALIISLLAMLLMTALGMALMLNSQTEMLIGANYRDSVEGAYVADAGIERVMQDVLTIPDWNQILSSPDGVRAGVTSGFIDSTVTPTLPDGRTIDLTRATNMINCGKTSTCSDADMNAVTRERPWGANNPRFRLFAWGPVNDLIPTATLNSPYYVAVWIADDPSENDDDPLTDGVADTNYGRGVLALRAEAFGPAGAHRIVEATIARTDSTEMERGYTGQRGQDEQNRRARKAAVQTPGTALTRSTMTLGGGFNTP
ncbi:MAG TPA: pilus assembly PilX N-terminal domain-containing protein [Vicinamibacterales bacterium]